MKKSTLLVWIHVFLIVVVIASVWLIAGNDVEKAAVEKPYVLSMTASVDIPDEMTFAGEKIVFDRYDLRERMDRELNSFTYSIPPRFCFSSGQTAFSPLSNPSSNVRVSPTI